MPKLVPHHSLAALAIAPSVWLGYFVATYMVTELGCNLGWQQISIGPLDLLNLLLWLVALVAFVLISYALWESWQNLSNAREEHDSEDAAEIRNRREFIARSGMFLCGISLLGTLWGVLAIVIFDSCGA